MNRYKPSKLPLKNINWENLISLIGPANAEISRFDGILQAMVNPNLLLSPLTTNEAVLSSKIEGTQATLQEVYEFESEPKKSAPKYEDIQEIINYRTAIYHATELLKEKPLSLNIIRKIHFILMDSVRGKNKDRGNFRRIQNWIGKPGCTKEEASYVPPPPDKLMDYLDNFEKYFHSEENDRIVQLAIIHAQFEIIHPFIDGNGRIGRILIPLFLYGKGMLSQPMFYISEYLESNREEYYYRLRNISDNDDWNGWIDFFLNAVIRQARKNTKKATDVINLYEEMKARLSKTTNTQYILEVLDTLFMTPFFSTTQFVQNSKLSKSTVSRLLKTLESNDIIDIYREGKGRKPTLYVFSELLDIIK